MLLVVLGLSFVPSKVVGSCHLWTGLAELPGDASYHCASYTAMSRTLYQSVRSGAACFRCGGDVTHCFVASLTVSPAVKELWKDLTELSSHEDGVYGHFGSKTLRQHRNTAEVSGHFGSTADVSYGLFGSAAEVSRGVCVYSPSFGIGGFRWFNFKSILHFLIVFIAFLVLISVSVYHNKSLTCERHIASYISYSCSRHTMFSF